MADTESKMSSAVGEGRRNDEGALKDSDSKPAARSPKKKKVRRHRVHKNGNLGRVDEETDDEGERKNLSSRKRRQINMEGIDPDDVPSLNYVSDDKPPVVIVDEPEDEPDVVEEPKEEEEEEEEEEFEEEPCMTAEEKEAMYNAASLGDIDLLEDCLDKPNSDINMIWYQENLLIAALKTEQEEMAEFLIDNGVDYNFTTTLIDVLDERTRNIDWYSCNCRQLAFERGLYDIVELIDYLNGDLFPFIKPKARIPRYRRPKPPTPEPETGGESENDASSEASKDRSEDEGDGRMKKKKKKKKKDSKDEDGERAKDDSAVKRETNVKTSEKEMKKNKDSMELNDADSGHHSSGSFVDAEKDEERRRLGSEDGSRQSRSRASSSKVRTGSSRCSTRLTATTRSPSPSPVPKSETFLKRFWFLSCPSDEGYSSLSSKSSPTNTETKPRRPRVAITIPPRGTRSSLGMRQASLHRKVQAEQEEEKPLTHRKVKVLGSYGAESSQWYRKSSKECPTNSRTFVDVSADKTLPKNDVPKRNDAHYMQMTASAYTKRKLEPNFRKAYSSLDFISDRMLKSTHVSGSRKPLHPRQMIHPQTFKKNRKENISLELKPFKSEKWKPSSLPNSGNHQLYRAVTRVF